MVEIIYRTNVEDIFLLQLEDTYKWLRRIDPFDKLLEFYDADNRTIEEEIFDFRKQDGRFSLFSLRSSLELYCVALARRGIELWGESENPDYKIPFDEERFNINLDAEDATSRALRNANRNLRRYNILVSSKMVGLTPDLGALDKEVWRRLKEEKR